MILLAIFGTFGFTQLVMAADPVYFPDANLKAAVESELGIIDPTPTDMLSLTSLHAVGIEDLTGIEYAMNLDFLNLAYNNQIGDLSLIRTYKFECTLALS